VHTTKVDTGFAQALLAANKGLEIPVSNARRVNAVATAPAGRVVHDQRGNAVWDWALETGVLAKATVGELLSSLADPLSFALEPEADRSGGWGGDPYNRPR
jgi:hypothetical protein